MPQRGGKGCLPRLVCRSPGEPRSSAPGRPVIRSGAGRAGGRAEAQQRKAVSTLSSAVRRRWPWWGHRPAASGGARGERGMWGAARAAADAEGSPGKTGPEERKAESSARTVHGLEQGLMAKGSRRFTPRREPPIAAAVAQSTLNLGSRRLLAAALRRGPRTCHLVQARREGRDVSTARHHSASATHLHGAEAMASRAAAAPLGRCSKMFVEKLFTVPPGGRRALVTAMASRGRTANS